jgi:RHS repeat-associated protein
MPNCATLPASGTGTYHHHDALGNVVALTNAASYAVLETYTYDAFGKRTVYNATGQQIPDTAYANTHGYTGREHLPLSGLMDYRNRSYSTILGRFLQTDPIRFAAGDVNLYRYVANNPVNWSDSTGHAIDTFVDLGLILNDLYNIFTDPCNKYDHLVSLSLNSAGLFLPFATGLGATYKAAKAARATSKLDNAANAVEDFLGGPGKIIKNADGDTI